MENVESVEIHKTTRKDWSILKQVRLAALKDAPTAFGASHSSASKYTDAQWEELAAAVSGTEFWVGLIGENPVGMIGAGIGPTGRYNLIGMWVAPSARSAGLATKLIEAVKLRALQNGHRCVFLNVSCDNAPAISLYFKHHFAFIDEWESLASHPHITVQMMVWDANEQC